MKIDKVALKKASAELSRDLWVETVRRELPGYALTDDEAFCVALSLVVYPELGEHDSAGVIETVRNMIEGGSFEGIFDQKAN